MIPMSSTKWTQIFNIGQYPWGGQYRPRAFAVVRAKETTLEIMLWCEEPFVTPACKKANGPVYLDSCLEAFVMFYPQYTEGYINFEMNALGTLLLQFGEGRHDRRFLRPGTDALFPKVVPFQAARKWGVKLEVPFLFAQKIYGLAETVNIRNIRANFYKCGDCPGKEHYACWIPPQTTEPDFHRPESFQRIL